MPLDRRRKITLAAGATGLVAVGATAGYLLLREDPKGELLCPSAPRFKASDFAEGDFVVVQLGAIDRSFSEATWARVQGRTWFGLGGDVKIELNSQIGEASDPAPLQTEKHGFAFGQELTVDPSCVWDRYRPLVGRVNLVCGSRLATIPADLGLPMVPDKRAEALRPGDDAAVVVAVRGQPVELLWLNVIEVTGGGQVLIGEVLYETESPELHGLRRGSRVEFVRDCVVETNLGGT